MCTMQTPLMKLSFYIAMLVRLLIYIRLDSIAMKSIIFLIFSSHLIQSNYYKYFFFKHVSVARAPPLVEIKIGKIVILVPQLGRVKFVL